MANTQVGRYETRRGFLMHFEAIAGILRDAADRHIRPRFRLLQEGDIVEKSPGELVTSADREAELEIAARLLELEPGIPVIGEEAVAAEPALLDALYLGETCWVLDPLDGTRNFIAGDERYGVQLALIEGGRAIAAWIWQPESDNLWHAERGKGTTRNGEPMRATAGPEAIADLRGAVFTTFMTPEERETFEAMPRVYTQGNPSLAASIDYPAMIEGTIDFVRWSRLNPWDHAPGTLILTEADGVARRLDGSLYQADASGRGILAARTPEVWTLIHTHWMT
jgi:fructose-1,6-bisphosphatase/inositol monophosphatase family enzyme